MSAFGGKADQPAYQSRFMSTLLRIQKRRQIVQRLRLGDESRAARPHSQAFSGKAWNKPERERTVGGACATPKSGGRVGMSFILMIMAVPWLYATGIYN